MVQIVIDGDKMVVEVLGWDKLWSLKSRLEIPLRHIQGTRIDLPVASRPKGLRAPGTYLPGLIIAGTFYHGGKRIFWNVHKPKTAIIIDLVDHRYAQLIVEVEEPEATIAQIEAAISKPEYSGTTKIH